MRKRTLASGAVTVVAVVAGSTLMLTPTAAATPRGGLTFSSYQVSATVGESCPNGAAPCVNFAAEPAIRADAAGNLYASSENGLGRNHEG